MSLAFYDPVLEEGFKGYHAQQNTKPDLSFCAVGTLIWTLTFFRIPTVASWHHRALVAAAVVSTLMPWILGLKRWTRHREKLVFVLRFLRTAALQAQFNPKASLIGALTGAADGPPPGLLNVILVSKCIQLVMFSIFFRLRFRNHLCLQAISLAIGWHLNKRTCSGWQGIMANGQQDPQHGGGSLFSTSVLACNKYMGTKFHPEHGCPLLLGGLQLVLGFIAPSLWVLHHERRSRREYAALCGVPEAEQQRPGSWVRQTAFGAMATLVGASLCWQLLEAYERFL